MSDRLRDRAGRSIDEARDSIMELSSTGTSDWLAGAKEDASDSIMMGVSATGFRAMAENSMGISGTGGAFASSSAFHCCTLESSKKPVLKARLTLLFSANQSSFGDSIETSMVGDLEAIPRSKSKSGLNRVDNFVVTGDDSSTFSCGLGEMAAMSGCSMGISTNESTLSFFGGSG